MSARIETAEDGSVRIVCFNPATGEPLKTLLAHTRTEIDQILTGLQTTSTAFGQSTVRYRAGLVRKYRREMVRRMDDLVALLVLETGKKRPEALLEFFAAVELITHSEKIAPRMLKRKYRSSRTLMHKRGHVDREPHGVAAVISPWNYPLQLLAAPMIDAFLAGNTVIVKPSENTCLTAMLAVAIFRDATGRGDLIKVVLGHGEAGQVLVGSPKTNIICFTGSTKIGRQIAVACAEQLKPCILELGGKDAMLVLEDANLKRAAKAAVWGGFTNAGQTCISVERVYVVKAVHDKFVELVKGEMQKLSHGADVNHKIGAVTIDLQVEIIKEHIADARAKGATVLTFGEEDGLHLPPSLITNADHSMLVMSDETFGPEIAVMEVQDEEEAIAKANDSRFGLSAYIFTRNERRGRRIAARLKCGSIALNDVVVQFGMAAFPFGGWGDSGLGVVHGQEGLLSFTRPKTVVSSRIQLPVELWWYDLSAATYKLLRRFIKIRFRL